MNIFEIIINFTIIVVCVTMGVVFLVFRNLKSISNLNYKLSLLVLSIAYLLLGGLNILDYLVDEANNKPEFFPFLILFISSIQATLFTLTLITLFNPNNFNIKVLFKYFSPIIGFAVVYLAIVFIFNNYSVHNITGIWHNLDKPSLIIRIIFFVFYTFQLGYYTKLFLREEKRYICSIQNYFSEIEKIKLKWVRVAFFSALLIGVLMLIFHVFPSKTYDLLITTLILIFYFLFALKYLDYNSLYLTVKSAITFTADYSNDDLVLTKQKSKWEKLKNIIIEHKLYLKEGVTLEELARQLNIARTTLSNLINIEEGVNFNTWINRLRIEEAKIFLLQNPDYTIYQVAQLTGYSEQSNFSRHFKNITGKTPSTWKNENILLTTIK